MKSTTSVRLVAKGIYSITALSKKKSNPMLSQEIKQNTRLPISHASFPSFPVIFHENISLKSEPSTSDSVFVHLDSNNIITPVPISKLIFDSRVVETEASKVALWGIGNRIRSRWSSGHMSEIEEESVLNQ